MRTIFYHLVLVGTFIYGSFVHIWYLIFNKGEKRYRYVCRVAKNWGKNLIWGAGSKVKVIYKNGSEEEIKKIRDTKEAVILISNHQSNVDIPALLGYLPLDFSFIAKKEISDWPVLGKMGKNAGTVFINRNSRRDVEPINQAICAALKAGQNVSFFPEARTSSGLGILPFKAALFQSAIDAKAPIQAVTLRYYDDEGQRTDLPSYAEVNLFQSLWRIVSMKKIRIRLDFSPQYKPTDMPDKDRYALKDIAETAIGEIVASDSPVQPLPKK